MCSNASTSRPSILGYSPDDLKGHDLLPYADDILASDTGTAALLPLPNYSAATNMSRARPSGPTSSVVGELGIDDLS